jgi:phage portal protein BeeE
MAKLFQRLQRGGTSERSVSTLPLSLEAWANYFSFGGTPYMVQGGSPAQSGEKIENNFRGYIDGIYKANGVVFSCIAARQLLFSEARFQFRRLRRGRPGDLFGTESLKLLERPWENGTTGDLLTRAILDVDLAGNFYAVRRGNAVRRLRPDWVEIILGTRTGSDIDLEVAGYAYQEGGPASGNDATFLLPETVAHFAPLPDPNARFRGMSWLSPVLGDIMGDSAATTHKTNFFHNGANLGYVVTMDPQGKLNPEAVQRYAAQFNAGHDGLENAYKTLFLTAGADVKVVGTNLKDLDMKAVQGAGETRICAAARVPPIIAGFSEGLESATYSNYGQARRAFADLTMRPLWRGMAGALVSIIDVPPDAELWFDDRDIPFLQEDLKDAAEIQQMESATITQYVREGFTPESAIAAVQNHDNSLLVHTGLVSVQLQEPGGQLTLPNGSSNGSNGNGQPSLPASTS